MRDSEANNRCETDQTHAEVFRIFLSVSHDNELHLSFGAAFYRSRQAFQDASLNSLRQTEANSGVLVDRIHFGIPKDCLCEASPIGLCATGALG